MPTLPRLRTVLAPALAAAACADSMVYTSHHASLYEPAQVRFAASVGPALAVIRDNPFPADVDNRGVVAAMQGRTFGAKLYFSQVARPDDLYGYKVVMNFGSSLYGTVDECKAPPTPPSKTPPPERITASAAFCVGDALLSDAFGAVHGATGPDDPKFQQLIGDLLLALTPPHNPNRPRPFGFGWF